MRAMTIRGGEWRAMPNWYYRGILLTLACTLVAMTAILFILIRLSSRGAGLQMTGVAIESRTDLCPGEWLNWHHTLTLDSDVELPARLFVTRTVYDAQGNQVYDDDNPLFPVIDTRITPRIRAWQVPETDSYGKSWAPGNYYLDYGASLASRSAIVDIRIPFSIRTGCK